MVFLILLGVTLPLYGAVLKDFFYRADSSLIKLTFKFDAPVTWKDVSPDQYRLALEVEGARSNLPYVERPMSIGPLQRIIFQQEEDTLTIWTELNRPSEYEAYDEAGGHLVSLILKGPFEMGPLPENLYSFDFYDTEVKDAILALAKVAKMNVVVDDSVEGKITASFENLTFDQALGYILTMRGLGKIQLGNNLLIAEKEKLEESFGLLEFQRFPLKNITAAKAKEVISLSIPPDRIAVDEISRALIVRGSQEEFQKIEKILQKIDVALEIRTFYLSNNLYQDEAQLQRIRELIKIIVPEEERVNYDFTQKAFVVRGTAEELESVQQLLSNLDRKLPQIVIDVKLLEINREKIKDLGVSWTVGGEKGQIIFGELSLGGSLERQDLVEATVKALETKNIARLVGNPRILTLSGKTATIGVTTNVPYRSIEYQTTETGTTLQVTSVQFQKVGVELEVTPVLTTEGTIAVRAVPSVSTFTIREYYAGGLLYQDPQTSERRADTTARLRPGETLVIGGLIRSEDVENITKIPLLGEIPILGELFTLRNKTHTETELVIFLTPYIVDY